MVKADENVNGADIMPQSHHTFGLLQQVFVDVHAEDDLLFDRNRRVEIHLQLACTLRAAYEQRRVKPSFKSPSGGAVPSPAIHRRAILGAVSSPAGGEVSARRFRW